MKESVPSVIEYNPEIPQSVENIIIKATAKNPKNRYENALEMHEDLETCLDKSRLNEKKYEYIYPENEETDEIRETRSEKFGEKQKQDEEKRKDKKINKALLVTGIITAILVVALGIVLLFSSTKTKEVEVPDVAGKTVEKAESILEKKGFKVKDKVTEEESDKVDEGKVIRTNPKAGRTVKKGATITLVVSKGKDKYSVEDYTGKDVDTIKEKLEEFGITVSTEEKEFTKDDNVKDNTVVEQDVKAGEELEKGDSITLTYAKVVTVYPDFVSENYTISQVEDFCSDNGITLEKNTKETNDYQENTIIYQSRTSGTKVISGTTLRVTYAVKLKEVKQNTQTDSDSSTSKSNTTDTES